MSHDILPESRRAVRRISSRDVWIAAFALLIGAMALIHLVWSAGGGFSDRPPANRTIVPGMPAPDFQLQTADGRAMHLADYKGRAVFLAFVPSWNDTRTLAEIRSLRASEPQFDMAGAKVMIVGPGEQNRAASGLYQSEHLPFPLLLDPGSELARKFNVPTGYRTTFVVTPKGLVKFRVSDAAIDAPHHGRQLIDVSKCCIDEVSADRAHGIGKPVGDYSLPRANAAGSEGTMETLYGDGRQRATVVLFLSVKCPCANAYNDRVGGWFRQYGSSGVRFVAVYANRDETMGEIASHARQHGFAFPVLRDDHALCADHFGASVTPECFVIDSGHTLRYAGRLDDSRDPAEAKSCDLPASLDSILTGAVPPVETRAFGCSIVR